MYYCGSLSCFVALRWLPEHPFYVSNKDVLENAVLSFELLKEENEK